MRASRKAAMEIFDNPILIGTITILVALVAVYLSYIAENGLPFIPTYNIKVDVANASELVKNADVRVGGARVGQVLTITPEPADKTWPRPYAQLELALEKSLEPLPYDTKYQVRLASVLGGKYVEIVPGSDHNTAATPPLPDGGEFTLNTNPKLNHNIPFVDLDTAFDTFGPKTQKGLRDALGELGDAVSGRGTQFNGAIYSLRRLIDPLENLLRLFSDPTTHLSQFVSGAAATTSALAAVAPTTSELLADGATTFGALTRPSLGTTIDDFPSTATVATTVLNNSRPVLSDAADIVQALKPAAALLPTASQRLDAIITNATPAFRKVPELATDLQTALVTVNALATDPASTQTFKVLGSSDLATFGSSAFVGIGAILKAAAPAQFACNVTGIWLRNFASALSEGDSEGGWLRFAPVLDLTLSQMLPQSTPSPSLHLNYYPTENSSQCQAGNEGYSGQQLIGSPPKTTTVVDNTTPPAGVLALGKKAGLVP